MPSNPPESEAHPAETPPAEAVLIRRARDARGLGYEQAAQLLKIKLSGRRWRQLEEGREHGGGKPALMSDSVLAHMAYVVGVAPDRLREVGRSEAAAILEEILHQERQLTDEAHASDSLSVRRDVEVPPYVTHEDTEDWEWEMWTQLALLSPDDKELMIEFLKGVRRRAARGAEGAGQVRQRHTG